MVRSESTTYDQYKYIIEWLEVPINLKIITGNALENNKNGSGNRKIHKKVGYEALAKYVNKKTFSTWDFSQALARYNRYLEKYNKTKSNYESISKDEISIELFEQNLDKQCPFYRRMDLLFGNEENFTPAILTELEINNIDKIVDDVVNSSSNTNDEILNVNEDDDGDCEISISQSEDASESHDVRAIKRRNNLRDEIISQKYMEMKQKKARNEMLHDVEQQKLLHDIDQQRRQEELNIRIRQLEIDEIKVDNEEKQMKLTLILELVKLNKPFDEIKDLVNLVFKNT